MKDSKSASISHDAAKGGEEDPGDMTTCDQREIREDGEEKEGMDLEVVFEQLGSRGPYRIVQLVLPMVASFLTAIPIMAAVFIGEWGYQPGHQCSQVDNITQVEEYLPHDVTDLTSYDIQYDECSIDVTVNTSGTSSTHSLPCVAGVNFSMPSHTSFFTEWSLVCDKTGLTELTQTGVFAGQAVGSLVFSNLADRFGRRKVYVYSTLCLAAMLVGMAFVPSYPYMLACRIVAGFFQSGVNNAAYTMFMELLPQRWRCAASVLDAIMWSSSCVFMATVAYFLQGVSWRYLCLAYSSVFVFGFFLPCFLDESLRWLVATGDMEEAERILKKACRMNGKDFGKVKKVFYEQVQKAQDGTTPTKKNGENTPRATAVTGDDTSEGGTGGEDVCDEGRDAAVVVSHKYTMLDLFRYRVVLVPLLVCILVRMSDNLFYYAVMLGSAKLSGNRFLNFGLLAALEVPANLTALFLMPRFNRRPLAFMYGMVAGCSLIISVALIALGGGQGVTLILGTVAQYVGMFALLGSYCLLFTYDMEVFPTSMRAIGIGVLAGVIRMTDMAAPFLLVWAEETPWAPGVMVGCLCILASVSIWLLPETRHRKLPDTIEEIRAWKSHNRKEPDVKLTAVRRQAC
ncbi:organic anion transporter 3-like [Babylonia areolata]|uniref:organic anion transporter 3-like n=1 Tax=Babylonia areolata TaxID=304850 RepID=UPI003FD5D3ED